MRIKKALVSGVAVLAAASVLVGCSDDGGDDGKDSSNDSSQSDSGDESDDTGDDGDTEVSTGGSTSVKVDGKDVEGFDTDAVSCVKSGGKINVGSSDAASGFGVVMTDEDPPVVESMGLVVDDLTLAVSSMAGAELGSAEVAVDGDTYTITGTAQTTDASNPTEIGEKDFEIVVTCD